MTSGYDDSSTPWISLSGARAAYVGPSLALAPHTNVVATVAIALESPFELRLHERQSSPTRACIALIPPHTLHHMSASGRMAYLYLDSLSDDHRRLTQLDLEAAHERLLRAADATRGAHSVDTLCHALGIPARQVTDPRIARAVRRLDARPQDFAHVSDLAALTGLSASHAQALFSRATGVPFRRYRLWRRMAVVMIAIDEGATLTQAAFEAGFASSSHLSAAFGQMFGVTLWTLRARGVRLWRDQKNC